MKAIRARNLHYSYNGTEVLSGIDLEINEGELVVILGPNGAGKSTLLRCLSGILKCGGVEVFERPLEDYPQNELAKLVAYVPQRTESSFMAVFDMVLLGRRPYMGLRPSKHDIEVVRNALKRMGIEHLSLKITNELSGGELQKVGIARALAQEPKILMLDEPTNNLDLKSQLEVMRLARELSSEGKTVILVMHDVNLALRFAKRFVFLKEGEVIADGGLDVITSSIFEEVYGVNVRVLNLEGIPMVIPI